MIEATNSGTKRELIPAGNYVARCYSMIHIGTVTEMILGESKRLNKVRITWELPTECRVFHEEKGEQPMAISKEFTLSMNEKSNLRKMLESWRGKQFTEVEAERFDITKLLGVPCMLSIIHKQNKKGYDYEDIAGIATMPKGMTCPDQVNPSFEWNYGDKFNAVSLEGFPEFIRDKIKTSEEYAKLILPEHKTVGQVNEPEDTPADEGTELPF